MNLIGGGDTLSRCFPVTVSPPNFFEIFIFSKFFLVAHVASSQTKRLPHSFRKSDPSLRYFLVSAHQKHEFSKLDDFCRSSQNSTLKYDSDNYIPHHTIRITVNTGDQRPVASSRNTSNRPTMCSTKAQVPG